MPASRYPGQRRWHHWRALVAAGTGALWSGLPHAVVVVVPEVRPPYAQVFEQIVAGVRAGTDQPVRALSVSAASSRVDELAGAADTVVIALGPTAAQVTRSLHGRAPVILGAVTGEDPALTGLPGISLEPDPARLYQELRVLRPNIRTVHVLYHPQRGAWLMGHAQTAAARAGMSLDARPVSNLKEAAQAFRSVLDIADPARDAVWLLRDRAILDDQTLLPYVLEQAWVRNLTLVSSNLNHVERGALFALFPDNARLGERLGALAARTLDGAAPAPLAPLRELRIAVNQRTARHLGVDLDRRAAGYDLILPSR